ncbi:MAG: DMT family transporter [Simkaniaceae bacterium]|nr:DMT family transporter [Candidatus Sacchlamyda saccharinae]
MNKTLIGILYMVLAMVFFSITYAIYKLANPYVPNNLILFFQNILSLAIVLPYVLIKRTPLTSKKFHLILFRIALGIVSLYCITHALLSVGLAEAVLLNNTAPLFTPLFVWLWMRAKPTFHIWIGLIIGFIGVFIILRPGYLTLNRGLLFALTSGIAGGAIPLATRKIAHEPLAKLLFYYFATFSLILFPFLFSQWTPPPPHIWLLIALSSVTMVLAQIFIVFALRKASPIEVAPLIYTGVIFSGILGWIFWQQKIDLTTLAGMAAVCIGGILTIVYSIREQKKI